MKITPKTMLLATIAFAVIALAFTLMNWLFSFSSIFLADRVFSQASPIGVTSIIIMLVTGGFFLFKIGFKVLQNAV